jgi:hypothetical protein
MEVEQKVYDSKKKLETIIWMKPPRRIVSIKDRTVEAQPLSTGGAYS